MTTRNDADGSADDSNESNSSLGIIIAAAAAVLLCCNITVAVLAKKRSAASGNRTKGIAARGDPNATSVDNEAYTGDGSTPDYHIPDFGDGNNAAIMNEPDYDVVHEVLSTSTGVAGSRVGEGNVAVRFGDGTSNNGTNPDYHVPDFGDGNNANTAITTQPDYDEVHSALGNQAPIAVRGVGHADSNGTGLQGGAGGYDTVDFNGAARTGPSTVTSQPTYDKQTPGNVARPASLYDVAADDGSGAPPRPVEFVQGSVTQAPSHYDNAASEVFGETQEGDVVYEAMGDNAPPEYETLPGENVLHDYEALQDRSSSTVNYEAMQDDGGTGGLYSAAASNGDIVFAAKAGAPGSVVYASSPGSGNGDATYEATAGVVISDVYATVTRGGTAEELPDYVHGTVDRKAAEAALQMQGLRVGSHLLRTRKPGQYVLTMCTDAVKERFAHHMLQRGKSMLYTQTCTLGGWCSLCAR